MKLGEMKKKVLRMIEEVNENNVQLTDDPDIAAKLNDVIQQVQIEVCRMKKIPTIYRETVDTFAMIDLRTIPGFYQLENIRYQDPEGNDIEYNVFGPIIEFPKPGDVTVYYNKYPERITSETSNDYEFELTEDALEVLPYGVAADILKSDISNEYGKIYEQRYETMLARLDPRYSMGSIFIEGGY